MKIYVGNLPFDASQSAVQELFSQHGQVGEVTLISDRETGRPRGFGFVEMPDKSEAIKAITALNGHDLNGRALNVNEARERADSGPRRSGGFGR